MEYEIGSNESAQIDRLRTIVCALRLQRRARAGSKDSMK